MNIYYVILYLSQVVKLSFISICYGYCSMYLVVSFNSIDEKMISDFLLFFSYLIET